MKRLLITVAGVISVLFFWWWITLLIVILGFALNERYFEGIAILFIADVLYSYVLFGSTFGFFLTLGGIILYFIITWLRTRMLA